MNRKTRILHVITKGNWGGAQRYVYDLATGLPKDQFDTTVAFGEGDQLAEKLAEKNIRVIRLDSLRRDVNLLDDIKSFRNLYKIFKEENPDVIHLNSSKIGAVGSLAGRLAGVPKIIFTSHNWAWNEDRSVPSKILISTIHWLTIILSHKIIAVSEEIRRQALRLPFVPKDKIETIYNGLTNVEFAERFDARRTINGNITEKFWVGTISELHRNKGLDILIDAFADLSITHPDTILIIIGEGEERDRLTTQIAERGLSKKVHLIGFVDDARRFLKALDVFVLASRTEAFPYVILEAGLAQLPVVATKVGGIPEVVLPEKNGLLIERNNPEALTRAIAGLLNDSTKAAMYGHNLRKTVEKSFSVSSMVSKTIAVYNE